MRIILLDVKVPCVNLSCCSTNPMLCMLYYRPASPEPKQREQQQRPASSADSTAASACTSQSLMTSSTVSNTNGSVRTEAANNKPPKPPRAFQVSFVLSVSHFYGKLLISYYFLNGIGSNLLP